MPVTSVNAQYAEHEPQWTRCSDAYEGQDAIKAKTTVYLPKLSGQDTERYDAYIKRALWYNASKRTIKALVGTVLRKPPTKNFPQQIEDAQEDITLSGVTLDAFTKTVLQEILITGRYGILVDYSTKHSRAKLCGYFGKQITNWSHAYIDGELVLHRLRLLESYSKTDPDDTFEAIEKPQYRIYELDSDGLLVVTIWREDEGEGEDGDKWRAVETFMPSRKGKRLDYIPFTFVNPSSISSDIESPPLLDLVDVNLDHYMLDAPYKHSLVMASLPQYWFAGFEFGETDSSNGDLNEGSELNQKVPLGADYALVARDPNARAGIMEFTGQGVEPVRREKEEDEQRMAALGARVLEEPKTGVEAADAIRMRQAGETSALTEIVLATEQGIDQALGYFLWWEGGSESPQDSENQIQYLLNKDFYSAQMGANMLRELVGALQAGTIDYETFFYDLEKGELTRPGDTSEDVRERIQIQAPVGAVEVEEEIEV